jgi:hypothetical protein
MNPYTDSPYAHERVGFDLHCEHDPAVWTDLREGDCPKCIHCREEFEHHAEHPQPCIERIAMALEEARGDGAWAGKGPAPAGIGPSTGDVLVVEMSADTPFVVGPVAPRPWLRDALAAFTGRATKLDEPPDPAVVCRLVDGVFVALEPWTPPPGLVVLDEPADPSQYDRATTRARWPGAHAESSWVDRPRGPWRWFILGTGLDVAPTGDTEAEAWAEAARRAGEASR